MTFLISVRTSSFLINIVQLFISVSAGFCAFGIEIGHILCEGYLWTMGIVKWIFRYIPV